MYGVHPARKNAPQGKLGAMFSRARVEFMGFSDYDASRIGRGLHCLRL
jgi:hypothetical protein